MCLVVGKLLFKGEKKIKIRFCATDDLLPFCVWSFPMIFFMKASYLINSGFGSFCNIRTRAIIILIVDFFL